MNNFIKWLRYDGEVIPAFPWRTWLWIGVFLLNIGMTIGHAIIAVGMVVG